VLSHDLGTTQLDDRPGALTEERAFAYILGDVHGHLDTVVGLLEQNGLVDEELRWTGETAHLWVLGDLVDRGPAGIELIEFLIRLGRQAQESGGLVEALLGNHDVTLMSVYHFGDQPASGGRTFRENWERNGGIASDLEGLRPDHIAWLETRPSMALESDKLLIHSDALFYEEFGASIEQVNEAIQELLRSRKPDEWERLIESFGERGAFRNHDGVARAERFLSIFGGWQIIHGHSPISSITRSPVAEVVSALEYASGLCVNVDGGIYQGGPGFVYRPVSTISA
jgi:hypothetical protein